MSVTETRESLLETALELIWQSNYNSVGVNGICTQAGVSKGAFYHHFGSKADLFCEATSYYWQTIRHELDAIFSPVNTPLQQLESLIAFLFEAKLNKRNNSVRGCPFFNAGAQIGTDDPQVLAALQRLSQTAITYNTALVRALQDGGYLEHVVDVEQQARMMYHFIHGIMSYAYIQPNLDTIRQDLPMGLYRLLGIKPAYWSTRSSHLETAQLTPSA